MEATEESGEIEEILPLSSTLTGKVELVDDDDDDDEAIPTDEHGQPLLQPVGGQELLLASDAGIPVTGAELSHEDLLLSADGTFQAVTIVPSDGNASGVGYVLIVSQQQEGGKDDKQDLSIYDFNDQGGGGEPEASAEAVSEPEDSKTAVQKQMQVARVVRVTPKKSQVVTQKHMCNYCNYTSPKRHLLLRHMKSHSEERPHKCPVCERGFKTLASLQNHVNTHTGTRPHQCKHCEAAFTTSGELIRHVRYRHTREKPHRCTECDYASVELSKLRRHLKCHTGERPYQCPHCTYASADTFKLKRHLRIHTGEKPYACEICHARFTQSNSLKTHMMIHTGNKPIFRCELCPATCGRKTDLRIHVQKLHTSDKPLICKCCGKTFPDRYSHKIHVKSHKGEKCFKCDLCAYASISQTHLESHMLIHTDQKPYACENCGQAFRQKQLLRRHMNLYHDPTYIPPQPLEKTHECGECGRAFRHRGNLIRHMALHDPDATPEEKSMSMRFASAPLTSIKDESGNIIGFEGDDDDLGDYEEEEEEEEEEEDDVLMDDGPKAIPTTAAATPTTITGQITTTDGKQMVVLEVIQLEGPQGQLQDVALLAGDNIHDMVSTSQLGLANGSDVSGLFNDAMIGFSLAAVDESGKKLHIGVPNNKPARVRRPKIVEEPVEEAPEVLEEKKIKIEQKKQKDVEECFGFKEMIDDDDEMEIREASHDKSILFLSEVEEL